MSKLVWKANYFYKFRVPTSMYQEKLLNKALHSKSTSSLISSTKKLFLGVRGLKITKKRVTENSCVIPTNKVPKKLFGSQELRVLPKEVSRTT
jgi:hypothetical protein